MTEPPATRYVYFVSFMIMTQGPARIQAFTVEHATEQPFSTASEATVGGAIHNRIVNRMARDNPELDIDWPGWWDALVILGCSLLRVEVERGGQWVPAETQPWGVGR